MHETTYQINFILSGFVITFRVVYRHGEIRDGLFVCAILQYGLDFLFGFSHSILDHFFLSDEPCELEKEIHILFRLVLRSGLVGVVKLVVPRPGLALVVPVGWLHVFACARRDFCGLAVISDLKFFRLDVKDKLVDVFVGFLFVVAAIALYNSLFFF